MAIFCKYHLEVKACLTYSVRSNCLQNILLAAQEDNHVLKHICQNCLQLKALVSWFENEFKNNIDVYNLLLPLVLDRDSYRLDLVSRQQQFFLYMEMHTSWTDLVREFLHAIRTIEQSAIMKNTSNNTNAYMYNNSSHLHKKRQNRNNKKSPIHLEYQF